MRLLVLALFVCTFTFAVTQSVSAEPKIEILNSISPIPCTEPTLAKSGCCSWHGGVCGCSGGRALCCDNTLSPSCGCLQDMEQEDLDLEKQESDGLREIF